MIITNDETLLRVACEPVLPEEIGSLVEILERELEYSTKMGRSGIGLAAPQIGIAKDIAIVRLNKSSDMNFNLVNCRIIAGFDPIIHRQEGCLSFPGRVEDTTRFQEIHISDNLVYPYKFVATGLLAVVCQHEIDHLTQKLFMDRSIPKPKSVTIAVKPGPNQPCFCGSGKKYKKCCGK
jgi:peptide deformylase